MQPRLGATCNSRRPAEDVYPRNTGDLDLTNGPRASCDKQLHRHRRIHSARVQPHHLRHLTRAATLRSCLFRQTIASFPSFAFFPPLFLLFLYSPIAFYGSIGIELSPFLRSNFFRLIFRNPFSKYLKSVDTRNRWFSHYSRMFYRRWYYTAD